MFPFCQIVWFWNCKSLFVDFWRHLQWEKLPDLNAYLDLLTLHQDTRIFPACWILIGQFKFPARQPYARQDNKQHKAHLTRLPIDIMNGGHTWHDYPWSGVSLTWLHRRWFRKFTVRFRAIRKEIVSSMYNSSIYPLDKGIEYLADEIRTR